MIISPKDFVPKVQVAELNQEGEEIPLHRSKKKRKTIHFPLDKSPNASERTQTLALRAIVARVAKVQKMVLQS